MRHSNAVAVTMLAAIAVCGALGAGRPAIAQQSQGGSEPEPRRIIHVSPRGVDTAEGTAAAPRRTVQKALDDAGPGDVVRLLPGVYRERVSFTNGGEYGRPVVLEGTDGAILDGSEAFEPQWEPAPDVAPGVYRTPMPFNPRTVIVDGKQLALLDENRAVEGKARSEAWTWPHLFKHGVYDRWEGVRGLGMYRSDSQHFLVRFKDDRDPRTMAFHFAPKEPLVRISGVDRCVVRNLQLRHATYGVWIENSLGSVVEHCDIGQIKDGVTLSGGSDRCTVRFNEITQNPLGVNHGHDRASWATHSREFRHASLAWDTWLVHKRSGFYDGRGIMIDRTIGGHRIHDNYIHDHWDGISTRHWDNWRAAPDKRLEWAHYNRGLHVHHNRIDRMNDDALEPNDAAIDGHWHHNFVSNARCGMRIKCIDVGPLYIHHNLFLDNDEDLRVFGVIELLPAEVYIYHNTSTARQAIMSHTVHGIGTPNYHVYNNLFRIEHWWGDGNESVKPNWAGDHNVYVRRGESEQWAEQQALATKLGLDVNSRWVDDGSQPFVDRRQGDLSLHAQSPARDAGADLTRVIPHSLPGLEPYVGDPTPDAGALSFGQPMPRVPRDPASVEPEPAGSWPGPS